jgi:hypothetical protein
MGRYIDSEGYIIDFIPIEEEEKALELYKKKDLENFKKFLDSLPQKYINKENCIYEEKDIAHLKALYYYLINDKKAKNIMLEALKIYKEEKFFNEKIMIYIAYNLIKFYKRKSDLEKLYSFILEVFFDNLSDYESDLILEIGDGKCDIIDETIVPIVMETVEWIENNLKLNEEEKKIINYIVFMSVDNIDLNKLNEVEKDKFFKRYVKAIWELKDYINLESIFGPLLKGIGWSYINLTSKDKKDIIDYFINSGVEEKIAKELFRLVFLEKNNLKNKLNER